MERSLRVSTKNGIDSMEGTGAGAPVSSGFFNVGQSTCFTRRGSLVQVQYRPPFILLRQAVTPTGIIPICGKVCF